jgi:hypothetical protein
MLLSRDEVCFYLEFRPIALAGLIGESICSRKAEASSAKERTQLGSGGLLFGASIKAPGHQGPVPGRIARFRLFISIGKMSAASPERTPSTEQISALIERVTFHSDESGFCVLRVKMKGQRDDVTVVGSLPTVRGAVPASCASLSVNPLPSAKVSQTDELHLP